MVGVVGGAVSGFSSGDGSRDAGVDSCGVVGSDVSGDRADSWSSSATKGSCSSAGCSSNVGSSGASWYCEVSARSGIGSRAMRMSGRGASGGRRLESVDRGGVLGAVAASGLDASATRAGRVLRRRRASGSSTGLDRGSPDRREDWRAEPEGAVGGILP